MYPSSRAPFTVAFRHIGCIMRISRRTKIPIIASITFGMLNYMAICWSTRGSRSSSWRKWTCPTSRTIRLSCSRNGKWPIKKLCSAIVSYPIYFQLLCASLYSDKCASAREYAVPVLRRGLEQLTLRELLAAQFDCVEYRKSCEFGTFHLEHTQGFQAHRL